MNNENFTRYGNYLGICIENRDPEFRGRVKIFIPHIMPALFDNWNEAGEDITIDCVGSNLENGLDQGIIEKLRNILPWSECAAPVFGSSAGGTYDPSTGNFNQTSYPEGALGVDPAAFNYKLCGDVDENVARFVMSIGARETGFNDKQAQYDALNQLETVYSNGKKTQVANSQVLAEYKKITGNTGWKPGDPVDQAAFKKAQAYRGDYGYFQTNQDNVEEAVKMGIPREVASAINNGGGSGGYSVEKQACATALYIQKLNPAAAAAAARGDFNTANALLKGRWPSLPGGRSHKPANDSKANAFLNGSKQTPNLKDPASNPDGSSLPPPPMPQRSSEGIDYTSNASIPPSSAVLQTQGGAASSAGGFEALFRKNVLGPKGELSEVVDGKKVTYCGTGARKAFGTAMNSGYFTNTGLGARASDSINNGYWEKTGDLKSIGTVVPANYKPQQGDVAVHTLNKSGTDAGHAQVFLDGKWHSWKTGDDAAGYFNKSGQQTTVFRLTPQGTENFRKAGVGDASIIGKEFSLGESSTKINDENNFTEGDINSNICKNTTSTQATPLDTTGMAHGMFSVPNPGALLWVFFREGNPLYPVYFAASYGEKEWGSVYTRQSWPFHYPAKGDKHVIKNEAVMRPNGCGAIKFNGTVTNEKDFRSIKISHANGGFHELHSTGTIHYTPNEHVEQIGGTRFSYCLNREEWTQGTDNKVTIGNQFIVIGTPTHANIKTIEKLTEKVKRINAEMLKD